MTITVMNRGGGKIQSSFTVTAELSFTPLCKGHQIANNKPQYLQFHCDRSTATPLLIMGFLLHFYSASDGNSTVSLLLNYRSFTPLLIIGVLLHFLAPQIATHNLQYSFTVTE